MRLAVYTDYPYHRVGESVFAERAFALFIARMASEVDKLVVVGRLDPRPTKARYPLGPDTELAPLPFYERLSDPLPAIRAMSRSVREFRRVINDVDSVWLLGPHPLVFPFAAVALLRRKRLVLGVRQDSPEYIRNRHPGRRLPYAVAWCMEHAFRGLARISAVIAVGPSIAEKYRHSRELLEIAVSLIDEEQISSESEADDRDYGGPLQLLSVGRLDPEKNPLLLAYILADLRSRDDRWKLVVCGEGSLEVDLRTRFEQLGLTDHVEMRGYVPHGAELSALYQESHALLHVSWTEGLPQVLFEAFAAGTPVVATDVGGIRAAVGDAVSLVPPGNAPQSASALESLAANDELRRTLVHRGLALAHEVTLDAEVTKVVAFISGDPIA